MTLIELLVALVIFAILGVMAYRAVSSTADNRERIAAEFQRWHDIANFFQVAEIDLTQIVPRPPSAPEMPISSLTLTRADDGTTSEISFLKLDGTAGAVRRRGYRFAGQQVSQLRWAGADAQTLPAEYPILDHVKALHCAVLTADGQRVVTWPAPSANAATMPAAIEFELELPDAGTLRRLFVIH